MRLSALEVKKKEFQPKMRGFDPEEVVPFLAQISEEMELLANERRQSEEKAREVEAQLSHYLNLEQTLERTLVAAQTTAMKMEEQAKKEAELILREAELHRDRMLSEVRNELERAEANVRRLRAEYETTLARMRATLAGFSRFLEIESTNEHSAPTIEAPEHIEPVAERYDASGPEAARSLAAL